MDDKPRARKPASVAMAVRMEAWAKTSRRRPFFKTEFLGLREEIGRTIQEGWKLSEIWKMLSSEDSITMSYRTFCEQCQAAGFQRPRKRASRRTAPPPTGKKTPIHDPTTPLSELLGKPRPRKDSPLRPASPNRTAPDEKEGFVLGTYTDEDRY